MFNVQGLVQVIESQSKDGKTTYLNCNAFGVPAMRFRFKPVDAKAGNITAPGLYRVEGQLGEEVFSGKASLVVVGTATPMDSKFASMLSAASGFSAPAPAKATV
jgi:hypothetical protein